MFLPHISWIATSLFYVLAHDIDDKILDFLCSVNWLGLFFSLIIDTSNDFKTYKGFSDTCSCFTKYKYYSSNDLSPTLRCFQIFSYQRLLYPTDDIIKTSALWVRHWYKNDKIWINHWRGKRRCKSFQTKLNDRYKE